MGQPAEPKEPKSRWKPIIAVRPNQVWETDITYVWCGAVDGWCYCFNVLDIFIRQWLSYRFDTLATNDVAIESIVEAVSAAKPECANLTLQCDNGSQYTSRNFRKAVSLLGIHLKFIWNHTPQQNGHIESFHNTLKQEYTGRTTLPTIKRQRPSLPRRSGTTTRTGSTLHSGMSRQRSS